jgi:hypothetical protein
MKCYPSKLKLLGLFGLTCALVGMCWFLTTFSDLFSRAVGWVGVGFFGLGFIAIPIMWFRTGAQVVINDQGIEDVRHKLGVVPWEDIRSLYIGSVESTKFLCIELVDPEKYRSRMPTWTRPLTTVTKALGFPTLTIGFQGLSPGLEEVWAYLQSLEIWQGGGSAA